MAPPRLQAFVDPGLGNSSYLLASTEKHAAAVIDPQRDVDPYLAAAKALGCDITHALDTHLHADFVTGVRELAAQAGAEVVASAAAGVRFDHHPVREGDRVAVGDLTLEVMETPGHSPEHVTYVVMPAGGDGLAFTGGALMVGGAARTDLLGEAHAVPLARQLYRTIHEKLLKLPDPVQVLPTHGAGSFCAAPVSKERASTIGRERLANPLAQPQTEEEFVRLSLANLPSYPTYFREMRAVNQAGPKVYGRLPLPPPWSPAEVKAYAEAGGTLIDVRSANAFADAHVPNAYSIGSDVWVEMWAGWLLPFGTPLVLVADAPEELEDAVRQLFRTGYEDVRGHLEGGMAAWLAAGFPVATVPRITARELHERLASVSPPRVVDVRFASEWRKGHIPGAVHLENHRLAAETLPFDQEQPLALHCASGGRSMTGISVLLRRGYRHVVNVADGMHGWRGAGFEVAPGP